MNNPSPLIPQGSFLEQKNKGRARVRIAVFVVLAIHGIGLLALLMQGCKKEPEAAALPAAPEQSDTNAAPAFVEPTNAPVADTNPAPAPVAPPTIAEPTPPPTAPVGVSDYKIVQGDTFSGIAKKFHTSTRAIMADNPGLEPTKLKIGQTIHIPPTTVASDSAATGTASALAEPGNGGVYTVKSGDTLSRIASQYKISVRSIRSANRLSTDRIKVGQQLKIPVKASAAPASSPAAATATEPSSLTAETSSPPAVPSHP